MLDLAQETSGQAMLLSSGYALGSGILFLLISLGMNLALQAVNKLRP